MTTQKKPLTDDRRLGPEPDPLDRLFDVLSDRHRRRVLLALSEPRPGARTEITVDDLVAHAENSERLKIQLYHKHLPKLAAAGYVEWDRETDTVRRGPRLDGVTRILAALPAEVGRTFG